MEFTDLHHTVFAQCDTHEKQCIYQAVRAAMLSDHDTARREEYLLRDLEQAMGLTAEEYETSKGLDKDVIIATIRNMNYFKRLITGKLMVDMVYADGFVTQREQLFIQHIFDQFNIPVAD